MAGESLKFLIELDDKFSSPANKVLSSLGELGKTLGEIGGVLGPLIAVEGAMVALGGAAILGGSALAIHASEAKQDTLDTLDAMLGSSEAAQSTYAAIEGMGASIGLSLARGGELAKQLSAAGVTNADSLQKAIKAIGETEAVLGEGAGGKIQKILEKTSQSGQFKLNAKALTGTGIVSADLEAQLSKQLGVVPKVIHAQLAAGKITAAQGAEAITAVLDAKFGELASKKALNLGTQFQVLKDNISKLFEDVDAGPFLEAFHNIVKVFDQSTVSGKAMKFLITGFFNGLFKVVAAVGPYVTTFLKGMAIIGLKIYIALKPLIKTISDAFGGSNQSNLDTFANIMSVLGDVIGYVTSNTVVLLQFMGKAIGVFIDIESYLVGLIGSFYDAGASIITGLVNGVVDGAGKAVDAVKNVGTSMLDKFTGIFGIHSPSAVMAKMGGHLMSGLDKGIASNDSGAGKSMADAVAPVAGKGGGGGTTQVTFAAGSVIIQVSGAGAAEVAAQLRQVLPGEMAAAFESMGITAGAA